MYEKDAPHVSEELWKYIEEKHIPLLGICYGLQEIAHHFGGTVASCDHLEYGHAMVGIVESLSGRLCRIASLCRGGAQERNEALRGSR